MQFMYVQRIKFVVSVSIRFLFFGRGTGGWLREPQKNQKASDWNAVFQKHLAWLMISTLLDDFRKNAYINVRWLLELDVLSWGDLYRRLWNGSWLKDSDLRRVYDIWKWYEHESSYELKLLNQDVCLKQLDLKQIDAWNTKIARRSAI